MSRARKPAAPNAAGAEALVCTPRMLPRSKWVAAARNAVEVNPVNHPPIERLGLVQRGLVITHERIAVLTTKYWRAGSVKLTVGFLDNPSTFLRRRILSHMNAWAKTANVSFVQSSSEPQVRIARALGGYWSYVGTDILSIAADQPTMNLQAFTLLTPESEFRRVVRHETGHTMGFPHEHMRRELVDLIDPAKAVRVLRPHPGMGRRHGPAPGADADRGVFAAGDRPHRYPIHHVLSDSRHAHQERPADRRRVGYRRHRLRLCRKDLSQGQGTNIALPYIDVVNEILELHIAADHGFIRSQGPTKTYATSTSYDSTGLSSAELRAVPQNVIDQVYDDVLAVRCLSAHFAVPPSAGGDAGLSRSAWHQLCRSAVGVRSECSGPRPVDRPARRRRDAGSVAAGVQADRRMSRSTIRRPRSPGCYGYDATQDPQWQATLSVVPDLLLRTGISLRRSARARWHERDVLS